MVPSRCLPDRPTLERLLAAMGIGEAAEPAPAPPAPSPALEHELASELARAEPEPASLPPIAELDDVAAGAAIFGEHAADQSVDARLSSFLRWLMGGTGAFAAFVADEEGLPLANHNAPEGYVAAVGALGRAQHDISRYVPSPGAGSSTIELDQQNLLQVVWSDTSAGRLAVGLVLAGALDRVMVHRIRRLTQLAIVFQRST